MLTSISLNFSGWGNFCLLTWNWVNLPSSVWDSCPQMEELSFIIAAWFSNKPWRLWIEDTNRTTSTSRRKDGTQPLSLRASVLQPFDASTHQNQIIRSWTLENLTSHLEGNSAILFRSVEQGTHLKVARYWPLRTGIKYPWPMCLGIFWQGQLICEGKFEQSPLQEEICIEHLSDLHTGLFPFWKWWTHYENKLVTCHEFTNIFMTQTEIRHNFWGDFCWFCFECVYTAWRIKIKFN